MANTYTPKIFITHSWKDIGFARRLSKDLQAQGLEIWFDDSTLRPGHRLAEQISRALEWCDVYIPIISNEALKSKWCNEEINAALSLSNQPDHDDRPLIIPIVIERCKLPALLSSRLYIDFTGRYSEGLEELTKGIVPFPPPPPVPPQISTISGQAMRAWRTTWTQALHPSTFIVILRVASLVIIVLAVAILSLKIFSPTQTSSAKCNTDIATQIFKRILVNDLRLTNDFGSPMMPEPSCVWTSYQTFDKGVMLWRSDSLGINAIFNNGAWKHINDTWGKDLPPLSCEANPPTGRFQPIQGFGKAWCEDEEIKTSLGFATKEETSSYLPVQTFEKGWLILVGGTAYILANSNVVTNGTWRSLFVADYQTLSLQGQSELASLTPNPTPGLFDVFQPVFGPWFATPETNLGLKPGKNTLVGVPFDTGWKASTQCSHLRDRPTSIQLNTNISNPVSVYLLMQAGYGLVQYSSKPIGNVRLNFSDGRNTDTLLTLGFNIRDWARKRNNAVTYVSSPAVIPAMEGNAPDGTLGGMDILKIDLPGSYSMSTLSSIQVSDSSQSTIGNVDPCIHLIAVTVGYLR